MVQAPTLVPILAAGRHDSPRNGGCFMEIASFLAGERWSDRPRGTHPALAALARAVNDTTSDAERSALGRWIPAVLGTNRDDPLLAARLVQLAGRTAMAAAGWSAGVAHSGGVVGASLARTATGGLRVDGRRQLQHAVGQANQRLTAAPASDWLARRQASAYQRRGAVRAVELAVLVLARSSGEQRDPVLRELLITAITVTRYSLGLAHTDSGDVAEPTWREACQLVGSTELIGR